MKIIIEINVPEDKAEQFLKDEMDCTQENAQEEITKLFQAEAPQGITAKVYIQRP